MANGKLMPNYLNHSRRLDEVQHPISYFFPQSQFPWAYDIPGCPLSSQVVSMGILEPVSPRSSCSMVYTPACFQ